MKVASGLARGPRPAPELAEAAVRQALAAAGLARAEHVILLLSRDFARQPQAAIVAAARLAGCLQVGGCTASGLFTEDGWQIDQPAAAALVIGDAPAAAPAADVPTLSLSGHALLPFDWQCGPPRAGLLDANAAAWAHGRVTTDACAEIPLPGLARRLALSTGLRPLGGALPVELCEGYELRRVGGLSAVDSLIRALPAELRAAPPVHQVALLREAGEPAIAILSANADGSLTLAAPLAGGSTVGWAIRQPLAAEQDMRRQLAAVDTSPSPDFALMFSCIGRGPLFYGDDDRDLQAFRERFPGTPLLGAYGSGQIAPAGQRNRLFHNSVVTLLFGSSHV